MKTISVIMGIYNCAETLPSAIDSILHQTFTDWELIMCDDGSIDDTIAVARSYASAYPDKITVLQNDRNYGLNYTLNRCLAVAKGTYIARMDGDDLCAPNRFEEELRAFEEEPELAIVSTDMECFDETGVWGRIRHPECPQNKDFLAGPPFCHAPCMVRTDVFRAVGGYTVADRLIRVEDFHLWIKIYHAGYRGKNIGKPLYQMRDDRNAYRRRTLKNRLNEAYVRILAVKMLDLPLYGYVFSLRPILVGMMPKWLYDILHKRRLQTKNDKNEEKDSFPNP